MSYIDIKHDLMKYRDWRNESRGFKKNNWLTPNEYLEQYIIVVMAGYINSEKKKERPPSDNTLHIKLYQEFDSRDFEDESKKSLYLFDDYKLVS